MMRLLGINIPYSYSPEAKVFARLLRHRKDAYDALVICHEWSGDRTSAGRFEADARARVLRYDAGWRGWPAHPGTVGAHLFKLRSAARFVVALPLMLRAAHAYAPDIIYSSQQKWDNAVARAIARRLRRPRIMHLHYVIGPWLGHEVMQDLLTCDHVVAVSDFVRGDAIRHGVDSARVTTIRNTLVVPDLPDLVVRSAVREELGIPAGSPVVGSVGRLDPRKGQDSTIRAFAQIAHLQPKARLVIVGDGSAKQVLTELAVQTGLADRIVFTGHRTDVPRMLAAFDVFAHPSRLEPFGLAIAEASAAALPVVAYAEGSLPEIVVHGETGLLASPGDVRVLALHLLRLLSEPETAREMGTAGRARMASAFRPDQAAHKFVGVISGVHANHVNGASPTLGGGSGVTQAWEAKLPKGAA